MDKSQSEDVGATEFDLPNDQAPFPHFHPFYGESFIPHPSNNAAKKVDHAKVMTNVLLSK